MINLLGAIVCLHCFSDNVKLRAVQREKEISKMLCLKNTMSQELQIL